MPSIYLTEKGQPLSSVTLVSILSPLSSVTLVSILSLTKGTCGSAFGTCVSAAKELSKMTAQLLSVNRTRPLTPLLSQYGFRIVSPVNFCSLVALPDKTHFCRPPLFLLYAITHALRDPANLFADPLSPEYPARL